MAPCTEYKESLLLDVYGELGHGEVKAWEMHVKECEQCQEKRTQITRLLQTVREGMPAPVLAPDKASAMKAFFLRKLVKEPREPWWQKLGAGMPSRFIPAIATAAVLVVLVSWVIFREESRPTPLTTVSKQTTTMVSKQAKTDSKQATTVARKQTTTIVSRQANPEPVPSKDLDVIDHLEMLKEMDELAKLVQVLDKADSETTSMHQQSQRECSEAYA